MLIAVDGIVTGGPLQSTNSWAMNGSSYPGSAIDQTMRKFSQGTLEILGGMKIGLSEEFRAMVQPVKFNSESIIYNSWSFVSSISGGLSYVDAEGEAMAFALSVGEINAYPVLKGSWTTGGGATAITSDSLIARITVDGNSTAHTSNEWGKEPGEAAAWWLRSGGYNASRASSVYESGAVAGWREPLTVQGIRPAMWINPY